MNLSPKIISVLAALQFFLVVSGYLFTRSCLKLYDIALSTGLPIQTPTLPLFVRTYGLWFLLVPFAWACVATLRGRAVCGVAFISIWQFITGSALTAALAAIFLLSAYRAMLTLR